MILLMSNILHKWKKNQMILQKDKMIILMLQIHLLKNSNLYWMKQMKKWKSFQLKKQERNVLNVDMILLKDMGVMVNLQLVKIILNVNTSKRKKLNLNLQEKTVLSVEAQWFLKPEDMVNLKHVQIIHNVNILRILKRKQNLL